MESPTGHLAQHATRRAPAWVGWNAAAMAAVVWHALIDQHIGLTGPTSREMTFHQGSAVLTFALLIAWWAWVAGARPETRGHFAQRRGWWWRSEHCSTG